MSCSSGNACKNRRLLEAYRGLLEAYEKINRDYERHLVRELAESRMAYTRILEELDKSRDPEEERGDGKRVRKDRWENGIRNIASILGMGNTSFEVQDIVERIRHLQQSMEKRL